MAKKVHLAELALEIEKQLSEYSLDVADELKKEIKDEAKRGVRRLKQLSPRDTGEYAKGWRYKVDYEDMNDIRITIYNAKKPSLTHVLENGHTIVQGRRKGDRVEGRPHIRIVEKEIEEALDVKVKEIVR